MYVLRKDLNKPGTSPYVLDPERGHMPRSSIDVMVELLSSSSSSADNGDDGGAVVVEQRILTLDNYLGVSPPRFTRVNLVKCILLAQQYDGRVDFDQHIVAQQGRSVTELSF